MRKILVVEDNFHIREEIAEILEHQGYDVICAENGQQGIHAAQEHMPDLIVSDIMMPQLNGQDFLKALQKNVQTRTIPFIFLTAKADYDSLRQGMNAGADDYLTKPFTPDELITSISARLAKYDVSKQDVKDQLEEIELLRQIDQELSYRLNPHWVITIAMDWALRRTTAKLALLGIIDLSAAMLRIEYISGHVDIVPTENGLIPINRLMTTVIENVQPIVISDYETSAYVPMQLDMRATAVIPMIADENIIGIIVLESDKPSSFKDEDIGFLLQMANRAAIAWQHANLFNQLLQEKEKEEQIREIFGRFVSRQVATLIQNDEFALPGEQRTVSILFCDIRDFTSFSEAHTPVEVVAMLSDFLSVVVAAAQTYGGIVNKFGGDSVLVVYGAPSSLEQYTYKALLTARQIQRDLLQLNEFRKLQQDSPIRAGIGINTGTVIAGAVGTKTRQEYTIIGDAVNLASRIESLTKTYREHTILISEFAYADLEEHIDEFEFVDLGKIGIRGKNQSVKIYGLVDNPPNID